MKLRLLVSPFNPLDPGCCLDRLRQAFKDGGLSAGFGLPLSSLEIGNDDQIILARKGVLPLNEGLVPWQGAGEQIVAIRLKLEPHRGDQDAGPGQGQRHEQDHSRVPANEMGPPTQQ